MDSSGLSSIMKGVGGCVVGYEALGVLTLARTRVW